MLTAHVWLLHNRFLFNQTAISIKQHVCETGEFTAGTAIHLTTFIPTRDNHNHYLRLISTLQITTILLFKVALVVQHITLIRI